MYPKDKYWSSLVTFLIENLPNGEAFIDPEVLLYEFPMVFPYQILKDINLSNYNIEYIVFHRHLYEDLTNDYLDFIQSNFKPVWGNYLFVVYKRNRSPKEKIKALKYILYTSILELNFNKYYKPMKEEKTGILITTYNRPDYLYQLLLSLVDRKEEILVVNDGSDFKFSIDYQKIKDKFSTVTYIDNPKNMGLVFSLNTGFSYFLSDPDLNWVHYFQDDVMIHDDFFITLDKVKNKKEYPIVTGLYREPHKILKKGVINEVDVYFLHSAPAQHILMHRQYLYNNLPIKTVAR